MLDPRKESGKLGAVIFRQLLQPALACDFPCPWRIEFRSCASKESSHRG